MTARRLVSPPRPACCSIHIFPPPRSIGCSIAFPARARSAEAGRLAFGTIDTFLIWRLTGGKSHVTDATNAARTLLFDIGRGEWDAELCKLFRVPQSLLPRVLDCAADFGTTDPALVRRADPHSRRRRRPAGGDDRAGLLQARHGEVHLRHRLLRGAEYGQRARRIEAQAALHHRLSIRRQAHLCAGGLDLHRRRGGAMVARRPQTDRARERTRCARDAGQSRRAGLSRAGLRRPRRALLGQQCARRDLRAYPQQRTRRVGARCRRSGRLPDPRSHRGDACGLAVFRQGAKPRFASMAA